MRTPVSLPLAREMTVVVCDLSPKGGNAFPGLCQGLQRGQQAPIRTVQACITVEVSACLRPLVSRMEPQEIESERSDESHLNGGRCLRKSPGVCIAPCLQG